jgi:hypothetical protein
VGDWFTPSNLGNGYGWVGNGYRNAFDPLGLDEKECCGKKMVLWIHDVQPFMPIPEHDAAMRAYRKSAKDLKDILSAANYLTVPVYFKTFHHRTFRRNPEIDGDRSSTEILHDYNEGGLHELKTYLSWMGKDPCFAGLIHMGHGPDRRALHTNGMWFLGSMRRNQQWFGAGQLQNALASGKKLDFIGTTACCGWSDEWERLVREPSDFVGSPHNVSWPERRRDDKSGSVAGPDQAGRIGAKAAAKASVK